MARLGESISFLRRFLANPGRIGAVAPSSPHLAQALVRPLAERIAGQAQDADGRSAQGGRRTREKCGPLNILELGPGTGAVTKHIAPLLRPYDRLDICEADPKLAQHVSGRFLKSGPLQEHYAAGRVRLLGGYIQQVDGLLQYDFIISGLPLTAFTLRDVKTILDILKRYAKPGCVFSYFEYIGIRPVLAAVRPGKRGRRFRILSTYLDREIADHQIARQAVLLNIPPAWARHLRFEGLRTEC